MLCLGLPDSPRPDPAAVASVQVTTTTLTISTYPYAAYLETRHSDIYNMDYAWLDWDGYTASEPQPQPQDYVVLLVENAWLRLTFLPELGGRLYGATIKATGEELLYQNPVLKPTHWGPPEQGWWLAAGGIEWCLPVEEHGYEWGVPWSHTLSTSADGATVALRDSAATDRVRAQITIHLPADQASFSVTPRLENPTGTEIAFRFWHNAMLAPGSANTVGPELRFAVPIGQVTVHSRGDEYLPGPGEPMNWPVHNGTDYSRLGNWNRWLGFFARPQAAQDWAGVNDGAAQLGMARIFPQQVAAGVKGFAFGWDEPIDWHEWTDDGSTYIELHSGPSPTFWDTITLGPGAALEWTETWLPLKGLPALSLATSELALGLAASDTDLSLGLLVAGQQNDLSIRLWQKPGCAQVWEHTGLALGPGEAFSDQIEAPGASIDSLVSGVFAGSKLLAASGDLTCPAPASHVDALPTVQTTTTFEVSWSGEDAGTGLASYDIQVRNGGPEAGWTNWLSGTGATSALFSGQDGHTYAFRSRAKDAFGNQESWPTGAWEDTFTTVLLNPAPVLITSVKETTPQRARPGDNVQFQIKLENSGNLQASVMVTDLLPSDLTLTAGPSITPTHLPDPTYVGDTIGWNGTLAAGQTGAVISFETLVLSVPPGGLITNTAWISGGLHSVLIRPATVNGRLPIYLPIIVKDNL
jgi:uncharacterized repeat protein (TIGR01451 family)